MRKIQPVEFKTFRFDTPIHQSVGAIVIAASNSQWTHLKPPKRSLRCLSRRLHCQASFRNFARGWRPFFQPPFSLERAELPLPNFAKENHSQVGSAEVLSGSIGDASLSYLCNVVLSVHVGNGSFCRIPEILKTDPAG